MSYSLQKSMVAKVVGISLVMLLTACSSDQRYKREVSGDEVYLDATALKDLKAPAGMILPLQNSTYDIPAVALKGGVGKQLDIRPPAQPLALLNGSQAQYKTDNGTILLENSAQNRELWSDITKVIQQKNYPIASRTDASQTLTTDWVKWNRPDEDLQYEGRYQVSVQPQGYQLALTVRTLGLQQQGKAVTSGVEIQRYNSQMMNSIVSGLEKMHSDLEKARAGNNTGRFNVTNGSDNTGLPVLIVRAPYNQVWERLPKALEKIGMKVTDSSRPQGSMSITYQSPSSSSWNALGAKEPVAVDDGEYKLQVGDLENRSSMQFTDSKGRVLSPAANNALVSVFQAAFNQTGR